MVCGDGTEDTTEEDQDAAGDGTDDDVDDVDGFVFGTAERSGETEEGQASDDRFDGSHDDEGDAAHVAGFLPIVEGRELSHGNARFQRGLVALIVHLEQRLVVDG